MRLAALAWAVPIVLLLLAVLPLSSATAPLHGVVATCRTASTCTFWVNTSAGSGWANTSSGAMSFQLPGEAKISHSLSYSTYTARLTGTYTYWTVGNFVGTDVNTGKVVFGTTNTNFTITCHGHSGRGGGCTYTYTTDNGTIVFHFTQAAATSVSVSCSPSSIDVAAQTTCTVKATNLWNSSSIPTGKVYLSSGGLGAFANHAKCTLVSGNCSLTWHPFDNTGGSVTISVTYPGTAAFYKSYGRTTVAVTGGG